MFNRWFSSSREQAISRGVENTLLSLFRAWGYQEVDTPILEASSVQRDGAFRIIDQANQVISLRPDFTRAIATEAATIGQKLQRCSYYGSVFRRPEAGAEGLQVLRQAGVELLGAPPPWADVEVIALAIDSLLALGLKEPKVALSHSGFLRCLFQECDLSEVAERRLLAALMQRDLVSFQQLVNQLGESANRLGALPGLCGELSLLGKAGDLANTAPAMAALAELEATLRCLCDLGYQPYLQLNLGLVSPLDYYSGVMFEAYVPGAGGPVITGGRYDALLRASDVDLPATGFAVMVDQLIPVLPAATKARFAFDGPDFNLLPEPGAETNALQLASELRHAGFTAEVCLGPTDPPAHVPLGRMVLVSKEGVANDG